MLAEAGGAPAARLGPGSGAGGGGGGGPRGLGGPETVGFAAMVAAGVHLFSDDGIPIDDQAVLASAMEQIARLGFAISLHEEDRALTASGPVNAGEVSK